MFDIIVDIDGTIANGDHRVHLLRQKKKDWKNYLKGVMDDTVHEDIVWICNALKSAGARLVLCSGRSEDEREDTEQWFREKNITFFEKMYLRPSGDFRNDAIVKAELYEQMLKDGYDPKIVFEDREHVVDMWRNMGLRCLEVEYCPH